MITAHALHTTGLAQCVVNHGGHSLLHIKENQALVHADPDALQRLRGATGPSRVTTGSRTTSPARTTVRSTPRSVSLPDSVRHALLTLLRRASRTPIATTRRAVRRFAGSAACAGLNPIYVLLHVSVTGR